MPAVASPPVEKSYTSVLLHLAENQDSNGIAVRDLPEKLQDLRALSAAWAEGMVEFGRLNHVTTGVPTTDSIAREKRTVLEGTVNWTGPKKVMHKTLKDMLAEDDELPDNCVDAQDVTDRKTGQSVLQYVPTSDGNKRLRLRVRLTDKGFALLAG